MKIKLQSEISYITLPTSFIKDERLSFSAKGVLSILYLIGKKEITFSEILKYVNGNKKEVEDAFEEFKSYGYIVVKNDKATIQLKPKKKAEEAKVKIDEVAAPKKTLVESCAEILEERYKKQPELYNILKEYLHLRMLKEKGSRFAEIPLKSVLQFKSLLNELDNCYGDKVKIVQKSIKMQWCKFVDEHPPKSLDGSTSNAYSEEEKKDIEERLRALREKSFK